MKPGDDEDPQEEGEDVDVGVDGVLQGVPVQIGHKVKDSSLVEDSIDFWNKKNDGKPLNHCTIRCCK